MLFLVTAPVYTLTKRAYLAMPQLEIQVVGVSVMEQLDVVERQKVDLIR